MEEIPWQIIGGLTPAGMLLLGFLMMMRGDLIPRRTHERELGAKDNENRILHKAVETKDVEIRTLTETNRTLAYEVGQTVTKVMDELQERARKGDGT